MKFSNVLFSFVLILLLLQFHAAADVVSPIKTFSPTSRPGLLPVSRDRALEQRAGRIVEINDALIQTTIQRNGGNYFHQGKSKILIFNHKIYKDFTIRVIDGSRLIIETEDGLIQMDVLNP